MKLTGSPRNEQKAGTARKTLEVMTLKTFKDPYEYAVGRFEADHELWLELFQIIDKLYGEKSEVFSKLHAFRLVGTCLKKIKTMYVLRPIIDTTGNYAWQSVAMYEEFRNKHLVPLTEEIKTVLIELTQYQKWKDLLGTLLGKTIKTPAGEGILKDYSPYGAQVEVNGEIKTFRFEECEPF